MEISKKQFMELDFDKHVEQKSRKGLESTALIVFKNSDVNAAVYYLVQSIQGQLECQQVATIFIQESICKDFLTKAETSLLQHNVNIPTTKSAELRKVENIPCLIQDVTHEHLESPWSESGLITMHVFRTAKEAASLVLKETIEFDNISIWHENHAHAYELVTVLKNNKYFINCCKLPAELQEVAKGKSNFVTIKNNYHIETMELDGVQKTIVFPIGCTFAN